jgi:FKBP-type peptidyl-prolyl cis-trans isomerase
MSIDLHSLARRAGPLTGALLAIAGLALSGCGSLVTVNGSLATPTPACAVAGPATQTDAFTDSASLTTTATGLEIGDISIGCGAVVKAGQTLTVQYTAWLANGQKFDSSRNAGRKAFAFPYGANRVIPGFEQGFDKMRIGGKRRLVIPPSLAYGAQGFPPVIPPNATLYFDVELISAL